jgi:CBS-domain-containing membrane protein
MKIKDCMKRNVHSISHATNIGQAAKILAEKHVGSLPVVDGLGRLVGLLQLNDLLELVLPDFLKILDDFELVHNFSAVETRIPAREVLARPVSSLMRPPISVPAESGLLRAISIFQKYQLQDLPVVDEHNVLVGIASRVDLGTAFVANWNVKSGIGG